MKAFDLFVLPSLHEGLGNSLLEALAANTPVVGSDVGGIPEVVGREEYLFEPSDADAIADAVRSVFESEESYQQAEEACRQRREQFDFDWTTEAIRLIETTDGPSPERVPGVDVDVELGRDLTRQAA